MIFDSSKVKEIRKAKKMTVASICQNILLATNGEVSISSTRMSRLETGKTNNINPYELGYICEAIGVTPNDLYREVERVT
jgi:DNA-binding Xre family transcriptional regulator